MNEKWYLKVENTLGSMSADIKHIKDNLPDCKYVVVSEQVTELKKKYTYLRNLIIGTILTPIAYYIIKLITESN